MGASRDEGMRQAMRLARELRDRGCRVNVAFENRALKKQMKRANDLGVTFAILLGASEIAEQAATLRFMQTGAQVLVPQADVYVRMVEDTAWTANASRETEELP
jgi:histidyl-tRNA synthetase